MSTGFINNNRDVKVRDANGILAFNVVSLLDIQGSLANTLKFWEMKGLTLTDIEDTYAFDFVVTDSCIPVIKDDKFVVVER